MGRTCAALVLNLSSLAWLPIRAFALLLLPLLVLYVWLDNMRLDGFLISSLTHTNVVMPDSQA